jgi:ubiquinone/menaquinone biosynthesis C-methylase UbiE
LLAELGYPLSTSARILDLGCGNGDDVRGYIDLGYDAFGCDLQFKDGPHLASLATSQRLRLIASDPYHLPFENESFELVLSEQVFDHVQDYDSTLAELKRVLCPGGVSLHIFPPRYTIIEPHVHIPLATLVQCHTWILVWTTLGIRQTGQETATARQAALDETAYLKSSTNYLSTKEIINHVAQHFEEHRWCELEALRYSSQSKYYPVLRHIPLIRSLLSNFGMRVLFVRKSTRSP